MAGTRINLLPLTPFDFSSLANGFTQLVPLSGPIDVLQYTRFLVQVRVHTASIAAGNQITVGLSDDGYLPGSDVPYVSQDAVGWSVIDSSTVAPVMLQNYPARVSGQYMSLFLSVNRTVAGALSATLSVDVTLLAPDERNDSWMT